jgi:U4/U6.U5 tri-snRNP-associated protein 1
MDLSIDEANKIRLSMGLPALPGGSTTAAPGPAFKPAKGDDSDEEPASTIDTRQAAAYDNWKKLQDEAEAKKKKGDRLAAIKKEREKVARFAKLEGKGLADDIEDEDDTAWLKNSKKRQKKIAKAEQLQKEAEEKERKEREAKQYTEADLAGVKVGHEVDQFDDEDHILVLKDTAVDAEDDDELEAVELRDQERLQERLDSKKRKRVYDPNDESNQNSILAQYDEEIEGKKGKLFTLDGMGRTVEDKQAEGSDTVKPKKVAISLDILKEDAPTNDYLDISEVKMKKPKKKKSKKSKRERIEDDEEMIMPAVEKPTADSMDVDEDEASAPKPKQKKVYDESFVDDDDLQATLAAQRQKALKKRKRMRPEDLARQLREEAFTPSPDVMETTEDAEDAGLVIDETTEFVQNLGANVGGDDEEEAQRKRRKSSHMSEGVKSMGDVSAADEDGDTNMGYAEAAEAENARQRSTSRAQSAGMTGTGLDEEKTVDQGVGATLALLKRSGLVSSATDSSDKHASFIDRQKFMADKMRAENDAERQRKLARERERASGRYNNMSTRDREEQARKANTSADMNESRRLAQIFDKEYKPNVELKYIDAHGREMNAKEAFKQMSHEFHGKGSGNTKTKKYLDKVESEKKKMAESSLAAGHGGIGNAHDQQAKKTKTAGVRLQ